MVQVEHGLNSLVRALFEQLDQHETAGSQRDNRPHGGENIGHVSTDGSKSGSGFRRQRGMCGCDGAEDQTASSGQLILQFVHDFLLMNNYPPAEMPDGGGIPIQGAAHAAL